jgi:DNA repair photolyase
MEPDARDPQPAIHGRGAASNPRNRFETLFYAPDPDSDEPQDTAFATELLRDTSQSILATNNSPDVGFDASINAYRGCEHGCIYCYARPTHEYLGFSAGLDFETKILVKPEAATLLRRELASRRWKPQVVVLSGVTDPYQPTERRLKLTRACLEVLAEFRNPVSIITKNYLVTRDIDVLEELARHQAVSVALSVTSLDSGLGRVLEPRASHPQQRLAAIEALAQAGVPVGMMVAPVIPGLNEHEMPAIIAAGKQAGAQFAGYTTLRLPYGVAPLFESWLDQHAPGKKAKVLSRLRSLRGGKLNDSRFGKRMRGEGRYADQIAAMFALACRKAGLINKPPRLSTAAFRRPVEGQLPLFNE